MAKGVRPLHHLVNKNPKTDSQITLGRTNYLADKNAAVKMGAAKRAESF
jgi:hypothetical protein